MGATKYPILEDGYDLKLLGACRNAKERGLISLLAITGMHISTVEKLSKGNLKKQGDRTYIEYRRLKNSRPMRFEIPPNRLQDVREFLDGRKASRQYYHRIVKEIGRVAGYEDISPMTLRHSVCCDMIRRDGAASLFTVPQKLGCSMQIVVANYAQLSEEQLWNQ
jgi:integrase